MPRKRTKAQKEIDDYTILGIKVDNFTVHSSVSQSMYLRGTAPVFTDEDDPLYDFNTRLEISGTCTYPEEREGDEYIVTIVGGEPNAGEFSKRLKDCHARDENGEYIYKTLKAGLVPIYDTPTGISVMGKVRGEPRWTAYMHVSSRLVTDMLIQLTQIRPLYMYIDEYKVDRKRWIRDLTLQSIDPGEG